jgi:uncharacterized protein YfaS (alpha-2-macroglobulin family)
MIMRIFFPTLFLLALLSLGSPAQTPEYEKFKSDAEKYFSEGSYARSHEAYGQAQGTNLPPAEARWVSFRLADTLWRAQAGTQNADSTKFDQARQQLDLLVRDIQRQEDQDRVWAEVHESLGDFHWTRRQQMNWGEAWPHYQKTLDWWAGAPEIELARERYLKIVWKIARPPQAEPYYYYGYYGNVLPLDLLENVLKIAKTDNDKAHAHYLIAMTIRQGGGEWEQRQRVPEEFEAALTPGKPTDWYDDALYHYAEWMNSNGRVIPLEDGGWKQQPDYVKALELFRRLVSEFKKGETRYFDQAQGRISNITSPVVGVGVGNIFLPESEIQFHLNWRNVKRIDLALYPVDLTRDVAFSGNETGSHEWLRQVKLAGREKIQFWSKETSDKGDYQPGQESIRVEKKLPVGAYLLEAKADGQSARDLVLVTDASVVLKSSGKQALVYFCNALEGSPLADASVTLWERYYDGRRWIWREASKKTNNDGLAVFDLTERANNVELFASAILKDRQAFSLGQSYHYGRQQQGWRIYAFTDRPAYRPAETVQWKFLARRYNGSVYSTPANQTIEFEIHDPRGTKVKEDKATLNNFGSAWGSLELTDKMPLGEYRINFWDEKRKNHLGQASLFRLEEYKLPEFKVSIRTPEERVETPDAGPITKRKAFRLGDKVEVNVQADYYFGGPVANASVEVIVYQNPFYHSWQPPRDFPWFYDDSSSRSGRYRGQGQIVQRETLKTDATGKATLTVPSPANYAQDIEYRVEARVTDASRREITGSDTVRVTRQRYYVYPHPQHNLYRPHDKVAIDIKAIDANNQPVRTEGLVKVTRDYWFEIWVDPEGKEIKGDELRALQARGGIFPPPPRTPGERAWRLKFRGYEHDPIVTRAVKTDVQGEALFSFTPERDGYYRIAWSSEEKGAPPIRAETTVWVASSATTELGYRHGGLEIVIDKETFRAGQKAPVMLNVPTNDRYVLFSIEGEDLYSYQLIRLSGTTKFIELPIEEKHIPNIFLSGVMVSDQQVFVDTKQVIIPPVQHFIEVKVESDRPQYQPREEGTLTITARNHDGKPVAAEIALSLVDESVYYIQQDYAADPRQFFFGTKRQHQIQTQSTFNQKRYSRLIEGKNKGLVDERELKARKDLERNESDYFGDEFKAESEKSKAGLARAQRRSGDLRGLGAAGPGNQPMEAKAMTLSRFGVGANLATLSLADQSQGLADNQEPAVQVRSDFRSTILWQPGLTTGNDGKATVKVKYPDSLTGWKATARVASAQNQVGTSSTNTRTKQPLMVRLQAPRFFVAGDTVTVSAVINNNTDQALAVRTGFESEGIPAPRSSPSDAVQVAANGEARVDWILEPKQSGPIKLKVTARGGKFADAMEKSYFVHEHGIEKFLSKSGKVRGKEITVKLDLPAERKRESTTMSVQVTPSMAVTMLDALPYLIDYPYGCTEQTMSRFLPAAITAKTLKDLGLKPEDVMGRIFGGIESGHAGKTQPAGKKDLEKLDEMINQGLERLFDFQHGDGGWGWWKEGESDHFMTAYVVWGLNLARDAGVEIRVDAVERAVKYLDKELVEEEANHDQQAWMLHALAVHHASVKGAQAGEFQTKAFDNLWTNRDKLNAYTRALLALSAHHFGNAGKAKTLIQNLENGVKIDNAPDTSILVQPSPVGAQPSAILGTAHWGEDGIYWRWSDGGVEATAFALRALLTIDSKNKLIEPVTNWLIKNRRGAQWSNTRDTAIVVLAMNDYLRQSGELQPNLEYELLVNGESIAKKKVSGADVFNAPSQFQIDRTLIKDGANEIRIVRSSGDGPIYFAAQAQFFSLEEPVKSAGNEIFVRRQYYKLTGRPTLLKGYVYEKQLLNDGETVTSGDRVESVLTIEAKNNYEYLVFEDLKPAGLEAVEIRSGQSLHAQELKSGAAARAFGTIPGGQMASATATATSEQLVAAKPLSHASRITHHAPSTDYTGRTRWIYQELRDRKVALFIDKLPQGIWEIRYDLRAEVPGKFHALPVIGHAMYVPEIRCNGAEVKIAVEDKK